MADNANEILLSVVVYYELLCSVQFYGPIFLLNFVLFINLIWVDDEEWLIENNEKWGLQ